MLKVGMQVDRQALSGSQLHGGADQLDQQDALFQDGFARQESRKIGFMVLIPFILKFADDGTDCQDVHGVLTNRGGSSVRGQFQDDWNDLFLDKAVHGSRGVTQGLGDLVPRMARQLHVEQERLFFLEP